MKQESKGNFLDFVEEATKKPKLIEEFRNELLKSGQTDELLLKFFDRKHYYGVSREDCTKLLFVGHQGDLLWDPDGKKY